MTYRDSCWSGEWACAGRSGEVGDVLEDAPDLPACVGRLRDFFSSHEDEAVPVWVERAGRLLMGSWAEEGRQRGCWCAVGANSYAQRRWPRHPCANAGSFYVRKENLLLAGGLMPDCVRGLVCHRHMFYEVNQYVRTWDEKDLSYKRNDRVDLGDCPKYYLRSSLMRAMTEAAGLEYDAGAVVSPIFPSLCDNNDGGVPWHWSGMYSLDMAEGCLYAGLIRLKCLAKRKRPSGEGG